MEGVSLETNRRNLALYFLAAISILLAFTAGTIGSAKESEFLSFLSFVFLFLAARSENPFHAMWLVGLMSFVTYPAAILSISGSSLNYSLVPSVYAYTIFVFLIVAKYEYRIPYDPQKARGILFFSLLCIIGFVIIYLFPLSFYLVFPAALLALAHSLKSLTFWRSVLLMAIFYTFLICFAIFLWSGFGRTNLATWAVFSIFLFFQRFNLPHIKWIFAGGTFFGPLLFASIRGGNSLGQQLASGNIDSNLSPIIQANDFVSAIVNSHHDWLELVGQFSLFFLGWVPRALWIDKPIGFGLEYTLRELDTYLGENGHSIASLFIGEHIYLAGAYGYLSCILAVSILALFYIGFSHLDKKSMTIALLVCLQLPTYVWGGTASFGARFYSSLILVIVALVFLNLLRGFAKSQKRHRIHLKG